MNAPHRAARQARLSPAEIRSILIRLVAAMLLAALDQTIVATAMPTIGLELGNAENLPWIVTASSATLAACFAMGTLIGLSIYVPIFLESIVGLDPSQSGMAMVPLMIGTVLGATLSSRSMLYFRHYKRIPLASLMLSVAVCVLLAWRSRELPLWLIELLFVLLSTGIGTVLPLSTITAQNAVAPHQLGIATAS